jgi:hypothetical protein
MWRKQSVSQLPPTPEKPSLRVNLPPSAPFGALAVTIAEHMDVVRADGGSRIAPELRIRGSILGDSPLYFEGPLMAQSKFAVRT